MAKVYWLDYGQEEAKELHGQDPRKYVTGQSTVTTAI